MFPIYNSLPVPPPTLPQWREARHSYKQRAEAAAAAGVRSAAACCAVASAGRTAAAPAARAAMLRPLRGKRLLSLLCLLSLLRLLRLLGGRRHCCEQRGAAAGRQLAANPGQQRIIGQRRILAARLVGGQACLGGILGGQATGQAAAQRGQRSTVGRAASRPTTATHARQRAKHAACTA